MCEKKTLFINDVIKNIIAVYFDTFFVFYFFKVANYEIIPLIKYYFTLYLFIGIGFYLIRKPIKKNLKVPYFRIGISLQALYIALIMILKDKIINYIIIVAILKGIADAFYHFPKNILNSEKIKNDERQKYNGVINSVNRFFSIIIPLILGFALTYIDYTNLGKIFFILFIVLFVLSFNLKPDILNKKIFDLKTFLKVVRENKIAKIPMITTFMAGLTYSSGVMGLVVTLSKINNFKTNLNLGFVDSVCAILSLLICILFTSKIKQKYFKNLALISGIFSSITLILFSFYKSRAILIIYLVVRYSFILFINLLSNYTTTNISNLIDRENEYKTEFYYLRDIIFSVSRCLGYLILFVIAGLFGIEYINYVLIISAVAILIEGLLVSKYYRKNFVNS